jgi:hypothetical protein
VRTVVPCRAPPTGVACHVVGRAPAVGPSLSAREPFTRTLDPSCQTRRAAWARWCCFMPDDPFHRKRRECMQGLNEERPASTWGRRGARSFVAPDPRTGTYPRNGPPPASCA